MKLEDLNIEYDKLQKKYGAKELSSIYNGGCKENPSCHSCPELCNG